MELSASTNSKFIVMSLLGDYIMPRGGAIWLGDLLYLLALLDVGEHTARSTINRMANDGWFEVQREGRQSRYLISEYGKNILEGGDQRIFEEPYTDWDGQWHLAVYSLPEDKRSLRNQLRKQLAWLGFGQLAPGTWISPHNRRMELNRLLSELDAQPYVNLFSGTHWGPTSGGQLAHACWDIEALAAGYQAYVEQYQPTYVATQRDLDGLSDEACFVRRFEMTHAFLPFLREDPNLPLQLLPTNWIGLKARQLFTAYRALLGKRVLPFMDAVVSGSRVECLTD